MMDRSFVLGPTRKDGFVILTQDADGPGKGGRRANDQLS